jgi:hypothetical protein
VLITVTPVESDGRNDPDSVLYMRPHDDEEQPERSRPTDRDDRGRRGGYGGKSGGGGYKQGGSARGRNRY